MRYFLIASGMVMATLTAMSAVQMRALCGPGGSPGTPGAPAARAAAVGKGSSPAGTLARIAGEVSSRSWPVCLFLPSPPLRGRGVGGEGEERTEEPLSPEAGARGARSGNRLQEVSSPPIPRSGGDPAQTSLASGTAGSLVLVGGGRLPDVVRDRFLELAGGRRARLVLIPTASGEIDLTEGSPSYQFWRSQGIASVEVLHTRDRRQANDPSFVRPLESATGVWIGGGDQSRLTAAYRGTAVLRELRGVLERGGVVGGTSAGASVVSAVMITGGCTRADLGAGFGLLPGLVLDQHFANRGRLGRLLTVLDRHPEQLGIGLDESTAVVLQGRTMSVLGEAHVWVCTAATQRTPVLVRRLDSGDQFNLAGKAPALIARHRSGKREMMTSASRGE
jgi:cyanophycinase